MRGTKRLRGGHRYDPAPDPVPPTGSEAEEVFGGGTFRLLFRGGSLANRSMRSLFIAFALISAKPGLWSPTTFDENEESSLVACWA